MSIIDWQNYCKDLEIQLNQEKKNTMELDKEIQDK